MPPKVVSNPYAKKRKALAGGSPSSSQGNPSRSHASFTFASGRSNANNNNNNRNIPSSFANPVGSGIGGGTACDSVAPAIGDALLPSNYEVIPGSFSQAFTSIDDTDDFRRASESFETEIRDNEKRESFRLAKVKKGRRKKTNIFERSAAHAGKEPTDPKRKFSASESNRNGGATGKPKHAADKDDSQDSIAGAATTNAAAATTTTDAATPSEASNDVRIHHTMLQPHVLYVSNRQKGNGILPLIRNVPIAYSPMVPDYILGPTSCALFLSIKYHKLYPRYIHRRIAELRKDFKLRVLLVLVDVDDNANTLLQLNTIGVTHQLTVILCWTELEAARYLETYKARDGKDATPIQKRESANPLDRVTDFLTGGRKTGVNKTDSVTLWNQFSTVAGIAAASRDELALVGGMGPVKVRRLHEAFHKPFSKHRSKARRKRAEQQRLLIMEDEKKQKTSAPEPESKQD